jgi:hypothetical protein
MKEGGMAKFKMFMSDSGVYVIININLVRLIFVKSATETILQFDERQEFPVRGTLQEIAEYVNDDKVPPSWRN